MTTTSANDSQAGVMPKRPAMNAERLQQVQSLFREAVELEEGDIEALLAARCGDDSSLQRSVLSLIERDRDLQNSNYLAAPPHAPPEPVVDPAQLFGSRVGAFKLVRHLGSGGMGDVFLGIRDDDFKQQAAIKLLRLGNQGEKIAKRFRKEMQFLAGLGKHPNITSILDAGTNEAGQAYIVMEYVDGESITEFCDTLRMGIQQRLQLFCKACEAVQFAHQNAVLHRDLKPGNLMITADGRPMLIDFGVAQLTADESGSIAPQTHTLHHAFTLGYASPEQIQGQSETTASDVYSLGTILYELVVGQKPHQMTEKSLAETIRSICDEDPIKPSVALAQVVQGETVGSKTELDESCRRRSVSLKRLQAMVGGDLECVLMKAIDREPDRRYQTVEQFADDVQRFLAGEPVNAQADSLSYRAKKFLRRNAIAVATAMTFVALLLASVALTTRLAIVARDAAKAEKEQTRLATQSAENETQLRIIAEKRERSADEVMRLFDQLTASVDPRKTGDPDYPARKLLTEFAEDLQARSIEDPIVEARLLQSLGSALMGLGDYWSARLKAEKAVSLFSKHLGPKHRSTLDAKLLVAQVLLLDQAPEMAAEILRPIIRLNGASRKDDSDWNRIQFNALTRLAEAETMRGRLDDAERELIAAERKIPFIKVSSQTDAKDMVKRLRAPILIARSGLEQALSSAKENYENARQLHGESDYRTAQAGDMLASIYSKQDRHDSAIELYEKSYRISRQLFGEDRQNTLMRVSRLAKAHYRARDYAGADSYFRIYVPLYTKLRRYWGDHHQDMLLSWAECLCKLGKFDEAGELLHECHAYHATQGGEEQEASCLDIHRRLVGLLRDSDRHELADQWLVPPEAPLAMEPSGIRVERSGEVTLLASGFVHSAEGMKHHATRWQVRAAGETFEYSPTLDVTTTEQLEQLMIPAGILLPHQKYFWRVAHVGQNRVQSEFSEKMSFQTEELDYELKPIDLNPYFNRDVVHSPGDDSEDPFQPDSKQLLIDGFRPESSPKEQFHGVPRDGMIAPHQLGDYQNHNAIQLSRQSDRVVIELPSSSSSPSARLSSLRFLVGAFLHGYRRHQNVLNVTLVYADGTRNECRAHCPDWSSKVDRRGPESGLLPANIVRHGIDRGHTNGTAFPANKALYDIMIPVDSERELVSIKIVVDDEGPLNPGARINILAITGVMNK